MMDQSLGSELIDTCILRGCPDSAVLGIDLQVVSSYLGGTERAMKLEENRNGE